MMKKVLRVLIGGGGISGLTLANLLAQPNQYHKYHITLFEALPPEQAQKESIGGGIGLWPPSQAVLSQLPNYDDWLQQHAYLMPAPSYRTEAASPLAISQTDFEKRFPVYALNRDALRQMLLSHVEDHPSVNIIYNEKITTYQQAENEIQIKTSDGIVHKGDLLIACDGIHSPLRNSMLDKRSRPPVQATDLGYTYFRANTLIPPDSPLKWWSTAFETWGSCHSDEHGNHTLRFGYVPLKAPEVFWFIAIKTQSNHPYLSPIDRVQIIDQPTREFLKHLIQSWHPIHTNSNEPAVDYLQLLDLTEDILRTDIAKIQNVTSFSWCSKDNRVILLGDSAHATAPNIAQGAGLCIEDAAELVAALDRADYLSNLDSYEKSRKKRATTVQFFADSIATIGQLETPFASNTRNFLMQLASIYLPSLQGKIFDYAVSKSLGGNKHTPYWFLPNQLMFERIFPDHQQLQPHIKQFKLSPSGGRGHGTVTVTKSNYFAKLLGKLITFPLEMENQPFYAEVTNEGLHLQRWKRVFGDKTPEQNSYETTHSTYCDSKQQLYLSEGIGGWFDKAFRFIYSIEHLADDSLKFQSQGMTLFDKFKLPLPSCLLPKSHWLETPTTNGWTFDGRISLPLIGELMHYKGDFHPEPIAQQVNKKLIIAGGSGMIGREVCLAFLRLGYDVYCLSRSTQSEIRLLGVKLRKVDQDWSDLIDENSVIINLAGSNPGAKRWSQSVKNDIANSRYTIIKNIKDNIARAQATPKIYLQASAVGIYGNGKDKVLTESSQPEFSPNPGTKFRIEVCQEIETQATEADCPVVNLRIGHVFSNAGGIYPHLKWGGYFNSRCFGDGQQYVPFIHIKDVVRAIVFVVDNEQLAANTINLTAPHTCTNQELLSELKLIKWLPSIAIPQSVLAYMIGESSVVLTDSERVKPEVLLSNGFEFDYPTIKAVITELKA
jgi:uncharacterized protein (TIGR01777 family)